MNKIILHCQDLKKNYQENTNSVEILKGINLTIQVGERLAIVGPSGSGKSTLLHLLGGLDWPTYGDVYIDNIAWQKMSEKKRCKIRNQKLGFIYQFHHLLPEFSALENVAMPLWIRNEPRQLAKLQAEKLLQSVGLADKLQNRPAQLSGGERQRVAIARALVHQPSCVLADEPTGNLDQATASKIIELMLSLNQKFNTALIIVTHDLQLANKMDRILIMQNGLLNN